MSHSGAHDEDWLLGNTLERQARLLREELPVRIVGAAFAYSLSILFLDARLVIAIALTDLLAEIAAHRLLSDRPRLLREPARRRLLVGCVFLSDGCFALPPALLWHLDDPLVKALAAGILAGAMMHLLTVRSIYLASGLAGALALGLLIYGSNTWFWIARGDLPGLALASVMVTVWVGYCVSALLSNHRLHRDMAMAARAAGEADAAKGRFLAQVSHELRTPLNAILGLGHVELRHSTDPGTIERLSVMVASAEDLSRILDDILDLSAIEAGRLPVRPVAADPAAEIAAAAALWRPAIEQGGLSLSVETDGDLGGPAQIDRDRLRQCLSNLLSNALRHTPQGRITIRATAPRDDGVRWLDVLVADDGPGVPEAVRGQLFTPFAATRPDAVRGGPGHGIGLSIARAMARAMGGDLVLEPDGPGARFRLRLPLADAAAPASAPAGQGGEAVPASLDGYRVLVVDDIAANRMVALACLRLLGAAAAEAATGAAALEAAAGEPWDAILLDMNMPEMDGLETFRRLRGLPGAAGRVTVVAMTADAMPGHRSQFLAAGLDGYLAKPLTPARLAEALAPLLTRRAA